MNASRSAGGSVRLDRQLAGADDAGVDVGLDDRLRRAFDERLQRSIDGMSAVKQGMPSTTELPWKISENDSPTIALNPSAARPCGACSRDDPQPKLPFTTSTLAPV